VKLTSVFDIAHRVGVCIRHHVEKNGKGYVTG